MTRFTAHTRLGDIVTSRPSLARTLEQHGLDYCCGGHRTLADACAAEQVDCDALLATLDALAQEADDEPSPEWASMAPDELATHLVDTHHAYLWDELPRLSALAAKVASVHGERHPELTEIVACYEEIRADLEPHLLKEEQVLFPMVRELVAASAMPSFHCGSVRNPISVMLTEHDTVGGLLARLRALTNDYRAPGDGCASYQALFAGFAQLEADTHLHVHKENNVLFPKVVELEDRLAPSP